MRTCLPHIASVACWFRSVESYSVMWVSSVAMGQAYTRNSRRLARMGVETAFVVS